MRYPKSYLVGLVFMFLFITGANLIDRGHVLCLKNALGLAVFILAGGVIYWRDDQIRQNKDGW